MSAYADTSFLVSLYTPDANSRRAAEQVGAIDGSIWLTPFGELELSNALELRLFRRELTASAIKAAHSGFDEDLESGVFSRQPMPVGVFARAGQLARRHTARLGVRTLDVLHVASALMLSATDFYTFDRNQSKLARAQGLLVNREDPEE